MGRARAREQMLTIRKEQIAALQSVRDTAFVTWMCAELRRTQPETVEGSDDAELGRRIRVGLARARARGLFDPAVLASFIDTMFRHSPSFDEQPTVRAILDDPAVPAAARMALVLTRVTAAEWQEMKAQGHGCLWDNPE
jgi:hypothetical protein